MPDSTASYPPGVSTPVSSNGSPGAPHERVVVEIVLVGNIENAARLGFELGDLLSAQGIAPRFEQRLVLSENELLTQQKPDDPSRGTVWVLVPDSTTVRLLFADRAHLRFLIRDIPLPQGMDDAGRESVEQIIESSFLALLQGAAAISRAEMQASMSPYVVSSPGVPPIPVATVQPKTPPEAMPRAVTSTPPQVVPTVQPTAARPSQYSLTQRVGVGYGAAGSGSDFGIEHGPALLAGIELVGRRDSLFAVGAFDWHWAQHHKSAEFDLRVQSSRMWLVFGWRRQLKDSTSFVAALGPGLGVTRVNTTNLVGLAAPEPGTTSVTPWARLQSGVEWGTTPLVIQLLLTADASFYDTHFEIIRAGANEPLAHAWFLRPGATLGAVWR